MGTQSTVRKIDRDMDDLAWAAAAKQLDAVGAALIEGDYLRALRLARIAAAELRELDREGAR